MYYLDWKEKEGELGTLIVVSHHKKRPDTKEVKEYRKIVAHFGKKIDSWRTKKITQELAYNYYKTVKQWIQGTNFEEDTIEHKYLKDALGLKSLKNWKYVNM